MAPSDRAPEPSHDADGSARTRILRGAADAFGRLGYGATSVEVILAEAGVSRRTFYKHFRSKEDVLRVLFESSVSMLLEAVRDSSERASARERLEAAVDAYIRIHAEAGPLARVLLHEQFSPGSPLARQRDAALQAFTRLISRGIERDGREPADPLLVRGVVAGIGEITAQMATEYGDGQWDLERARRAILRLLRALDGA